MNNIINLLMFIGIFATFIILHELLHIIPANFFKIKFKVFIIKKKYIPLGIGLGSEYFDKSFFDLNTHKQIQYTVIALFPYIFIIPLCYFFMFQKTFFWYFTGIVILLGQILNIPLEFLITKKD